MKLTMYVLSALIVLGTELNPDDFTGSFKDEEADEFHGDHYQGGGDLDGYPDDFHPDHDDFHGDEFADMHGEEFADMHGSEYADMHGDAMHADDMPGNIHAEGELTATNFDEETEGKTVFIKFFSPWCENCTDMEPAWTELKDVYADITTALISEVDCHGPGEDLCINLNIDDHFPTLMYGNPKKLQKYTGSLEFYALLAFAAKNVAPFCGPGNMNLCNANEKSKINSLLGQGLESLKKKIAGVEGIITSAETKFEEEVEKLYDDIEGKYNKLLLEKEKSLDELREKNDIGLMRTVLDHLRDKFPDHIDL